jgi:hypothetical protein
MVSISCKILFWVTGQAHRKPRFYFEVFTFIDYTERRYGFSWGKYKYLFETGFDINVATSDII